MAEKLTPDICVIGAGAGGLAVATTAAAYGARVVLIERDKLGGGDLHTGSVPSKALIAAANRAQSLGSNDFGVKAARPKVEFMNVHDHIVDAIARIEPNASKERLAGLGIRLIEGAARFRDAATVVAGDIEIAARRFVIATGSSPVLPPIEGLVDAPYLTSENVFDLRVSPKTLIVIGAGRIGLELAQAFARLGSEVVVIDSGEPLRREEPEAMRVVIEALKRDGVTVRANTEIARVRKLRGKVAVDLANGENIEGSHLLVAAGRQPNLADLGLDAARIRHETRGILVNAGMRTTNKRVSAIGDVTRSPHFAHLATHHAEIVISEAIFRRSAKFDEHVIPRVTYTDPEIAHVGLIEQQARDRRHQVRVLRWPFSENSRAQLERATSGHVKVVTDRSGRVLGATIVGRNAGELITAWTLAVKQRLDVRQVAGTVVPHPTFSQAGKSAAMGAFAPGLTRSWVRRIIGRLGWFG